MRRRILSLLENGGLPLDALSDCARVTLIGRSSVFIEGAHSVLELTGERIRLATGEGVLAVCGCSLTLNSLSGDQAVVSGKMIASVSYQ